MNQSALSSYLLHYASFVASNVASVTYAVVQHFLTESLELLIFFFSFLKASCLEAEK